MAELKNEDVFKDGVEVLSISDYAKKYADGVSLQAIDYAMKNDKIDYITISKDRHVVMTEKTRTYVPNNNVNRADKLQV
jgi:hypothetical protein